MKYLVSPPFFLITFLFLLISATTKKDQKPKLHFINNESNSIRVMTFNLRLDTPNDGENAWPHRKDMVASTMRYHEADFVGIQEGLPHQLDELDELLPYFKRIGVGRNGDEENPGEYSALFYRASRFELLDNATFWLSETPDEPGSMGWDAAFPRIVTWGKFQDNETDKTLFVFNTHFDHRGETARENSASLILKKIDEIAGKSPVVLTGDFNVTEDQAPYKILTDTSGDSNVNLTDSFYHSMHEHHGPTSTWNGFEAIVPDRRIDFIFTNSGFSVIQHATISDQQDGRFPSDHLPVAADIAFAQ